MSTELNEKVDGILKSANIPDRHTYFQIEKFMIGKEPTAQAQLWSIARELQARKESVEVHMKELKDAEDNLELFDIRIERLDRRIKRLAGKKGLYTDLNIQECEINIRKLQREKQALVKSAQKANHRMKAIQEEMAHLVAGYDKIISQVGEMRPLDDEQSQKEMWNEKLLEEFNLRIILQRPFDPEFVKTVMCLHDDAPVKKQMVAALENYQQRMIAHRKAAALAEAKPSQSIEMKPKVQGK